MEKLSRRKLIRSASLGAAVMALGLNRAVAQWVDLSGEDEYVSDFTGAIISLGDSGFGFDSKYNSDGDTVEVVLMSNDTSVTAISFLPSGTDAEAYIQDQRDELTSFYPVAEEAGAGIISDGGWLAMGIATQTGRQRGVYVELQLGAFPDHDLVVNFTADLDTFAEDFESLQRVTIEGFEPFLFLEESGIETLALPAVAVASSTTGRSSRGSSSSSSSTGRRSSSSSSGTNSRSTSTTEDDSFVDEVRTHRTEFLGEFTEFLESVLMFGEESSTEADLQNAFATMDRLADVWVGYPARAGAVSAPSELRDLETLYITWADEIAELGNLWIEARNGIAEVADVFDQLDVVNETDKDLGAALSAL